MKNEEYTHDAAEMETTQTAANGIAPLAGNDATHPYTDLAVTEQLPQSLQHAPLRRRQTELPKPFNGLTPRRLSSSLTGSCTTFVNCAISAARLSTSTTGGRSRRAFLRV